MDFSHVINWKQAVPPHRYGRRALAFTTALCEVAHELVAMNAQVLRQIEGEKKKARSQNRARINEMEKKASEVDGKKKAVEFQITQWIHAVFVHRYRDVDPHIRLDCIQSLGDWIAVYPEMFFQGTFLRYFGWVLSDLNAPTRHEVLRALTKLYQDSEKMDGMRLFTERFRPRLVEMATQDSDPHVRSSAIHLLDILRASGYLEPDDIDSIGRLIFDNEPRVRKAVINFFAQNVEDAYDLLVEELGGTDALEEAFGPADLDDEDFDSPRIEWLKLKCLADVLVAYDAEDEVDPRDALTVPGTDTAVIIPAMESRFSLAAENLADRIPELKWEILAGYLLYDHSRTPTQNGVNGADTNALLKQTVKPSEQQETLLLEVLYASVKLDLGSHVEKAKATKAQKAAEQDARELASRHLAGLIPRLLNKFRRAAGRSLPDIAPCASARPRGSGCGDVRRCAGGGQEAISHPRQPARAGRRADGTAARHEQRLGGRGARQNRRPPRGRRLAAQPDRAGRRPDAPGQHEREEAGRL